MEFPIILANYECQNNSKKCSLNGHNLTITKDKIIQSVLNFKKSKNIRFFLDFRQKPKKKHKTVW